MGRGGRSIEEKTRNDKEINKLRNGMLESPPISKDSMKMICEIYVRGLMRRRVLSLRKKIKVIEGGRWMHSKGKKLREYEKIKRWIDKGGGKEISYKLKSVDVKFNFEKFEFRSSWNVKDGLLRF